MKAKFLPLLLAALALGCLPESPEGNPSPSPQPSASPTGPVNVDAVSHPLVPRGSTFTLTGNGFVAVNDVTIGTVSQAHTVVSDTEITIDGLDMATPLGLRDIVVSADAGDSPAFLADVIEIVPVAGSTSSAATGFARGWDLSGFPGFDDQATTTVSIGGVDQPLDTATASNISVTVVDATTPPGAQPLSFDNGGTATAPIDATVVSLTISEVDSNDEGADNMEFVEIATGAPGASLDGFVLVLYNGGAVNDPSYQAVNLSSGTEVTNTDGLFLVGSLTLNPEIEMPTAVQNGTDGVALYRGTTADFPGGTPPTMTNLIDAVLYVGPAGPDMPLATALLGDANATHIDEDANMNTDFDSITRCAAGNLNTDGSVWEVVTSTPGAGNTNCP